LSKEWLRVGKGDLPALRLGSPLTTCKFHTYCQINVVFITLDNIRILIFLDVTWCTLVSSPIMKRRPKAPLKYNLLDNIWAGTVGSVCIYWLRYGMEGSWFPSRCWDPHSSLFNGHTASIFWVSNGGCEFDHSPPSSADVKNEYRYTSAPSPNPPPPLYTFIVWIGTSPLIYVYIHGEVYVEDGGSTFLCNISKCLQAHTNSHAIATALTALVRPCIYVVQCEIR